MLRNKPTRAWSVGPMAACTCLSAIHHSKCVINRLAITVMSSCNRKVTLKWIRNYSASWTSCLSLWLAREREPCYWTRKKLKREAVNVSQGEPASSSRNINFRQCSLVWSIPRTSHKNKRAKSRWRKVELNSDELHEAKSLMRTIWTTTQTTKATLVRLKLNTDAWTAKTYVLRQFSERS